MGTGKMKLRLGKLPSDTKKKWKGYRVQSYFHYFTELISS